MLLQKDLGDRTQLPALPGVDGLEPTAVPGPTSRLHLADHERRPPSYDEIELADPAPPIARDHSVAARDVPSLGGGFATPADLAPLIQDARR